MARILRSRILLINISRKDIRCIIVLRLCHRKAQQKGCKITFLIDINTPEILIQTPEIMKKLLFLTVQFIVLCMAMFGLSPAFAQFEDQHDVPFIISALESSIPDDVIAEARAFDDHLMSTGEIQGTKVYLVTDSRSQRVNLLVRKLLEAMGQENHEWVVRVIDTKPPVANAFVTGGKYIYVYTGLIKEASSDDELAFVLSHELGHSLLKHGLRRQQDMTNTLANLAELVAAIAIKNSYDDVKGVTEAVKASYSRVDEEEADALAVSIAWRAGFDPLRGADFFNREARRSNEDQEQIAQLLKQKRNEVTQAQSLCQQWIAAVRNAWMPSPNDVNKANAKCNDAEQKRLAYNQMVAEYNLAKSEQSLNVLYSTHPNSQNRVAAIAALTDFMHGRRNLDTLQQFQQSYRVMVALKQKDSILLKQPIKQISQPKTVSEQPRGHERTMAEQLKQLKDALDHGLITDEEYQLKRQQILDRL